MAGVPVSVGEMGTRSSGNRVSNLFTSIPTNVADPIERVRTVHQMMKGAKEVHNALGAEMLSDWTELTPPRPFAAFMRFYSRRELASRHRPPINVVISNVPGPTTPLDVSGARTEVPALVGQRVPDVLLLNDDDLTYTKLRLDDRSMATVVNHITGFASSLPRAA